ncbi:MAG: ankyrin repeat domain-containing protein [Candidatus Micrarchaeota archaeon]|nr:ankyrin repeat domain-containing protein [Candidatus Micrarchaeota archaeon]
MVQRLSGSMSETSTKQLNLEKRKLSTEKRKISPEKQRRLDEMLIEAAKKGKLERIERLLKAGADIDTRRCKQGSGYDGRTALMHAASTGYTPTCALLLEKGASIEAKDVNDLTPLMIAAESGKISTCAFLIEKGADLNAKTKKVGWTVKTLAEIAEKSFQRGTAAFLRSIKKLQELVGKENVKEFLSSFRECISS